MQDYGLARTTGAYNKSSSVTDSTESANTVWRGMIKDNAGNTKTCTVAFDKYIDKSAPTIAWSTNKYPVSGTTFYESALTITGTCQDNLSGVSGTVSESTTFYSSAVGQQASKYCIDKAGNSITHKSYYYTVKYWSENDINCGCDQYDYPVLGYNQVCHVPPVLRGEIYECPSSWSFIACNDILHIPGCTTWNTVPRYGAQDCIKYRSCWRP